MTEVKIQKKIRKPLPKRTTDHDDFSGWLETLGLISTPKVHVNGANYSMAVVTVDFGTPLNESTQLTAEQNAELMFRIKKLTKSLYRHEMNVRIQNDSSNGIWWSTVN